MNSRFNVVTDQELGQTTGGANNWEANVAGVAVAATSGAALGGLICGPGCAYLGAHYGPILWAGVTGATGGFGRTHR